MISSRTIVDTCVVGDDLIFFVIPYIWVVADIEEFSVAVGLQTINIVEGIIEETT